MKYSRIPIDTFDQLQVGAGVLLSKFDPTIGDIEDANILGATDGGINATAVPSFIDLADGIDNTIADMMEGKQIEKWECRISGTFKTANPDLIKRLLAAADIDGDKITLRDHLLDEDFSDIWFVADYTRKNDGEDAGFLAVHLKNALSTDGLNWQSENNGKASFSANFLGHVSQKNQHEVPFEFYIHRNTAAA